MKRFICILISVMLLGGISVCAEDGDYQKNYDEYGIGKITDALDEKTEKILEENGIDLKNERFVDNLKPQNVFSFVFSLFKSGFKKPLTALLTVLCLVAVCSAAGSISNDKNMFYVNIAATVAALLTVAKDLWSIIIVSVDVIKTAASFMISFIPVFVGLTAAEGRGFSAAGMGTVLLLSADFVSSAAAFFILPLLGGHLSISIAASVSPLLENSGIADTIKKISVWALSLTSTVFLGVLGIQNTVNSAADNVALKTAKFILGTGIPVAGSAISEAMSNVVASIGLLRSTVGIYAITAICVMLIPVLADILLWRFMLTASSGVAMLFSQKKTANLLKAAEGTLSVLTGILILVFALFVISLAVVLK